MGAHIALDIGGTFTDLVYFNDGTGELRNAKSSTTPDDFTLGIENCLAKAGIDLSTCETFVHGATIAINTLIEHIGARTALVATAGAGDAYLIGRGNRPEANIRTGDPVMTRIMACIEVTVSERLTKLYPRQWGAAVTVRAGGRTCEREVLHPRGDPENPLDWDGIAKKLDTMSRYLKRPVPTQVLQLQAKGLDFRACLTTVSDALMR